MKQQPNIADSGFRGRSARRLVSTGISLALAVPLVAATAGVSIPGAGPGVASAAPDLSNGLVGKTVFVDPGHQGTEHNENLARQVDNGRGGTKDCQTTGMTSMHGVPEHTINWKVAEVVRQGLQALGATVVMSRQDDTGWGGCVDERAAAANRSGAAVAVSIHADGAPAEDHGFHLIVPALPVQDAKAGAVQSGPGRAATKAVHDAYVAAGFTPATYAGAVDGIQTRDDIAGPALTEVPDVFIEMGNGANPDDAQLLETPEGQLRHAVAITNGLVAYLAGVAVPPASAAVAPPAPQAPAEAANTGQATGPSQTVPGGVPGPAGVTAAPGQYSTGTGQGTAAGNLAQTLAQTILGQNPTGAGATAGGDTTASVLGTLAQSLFGGSNGTSPNSATPGAAVPNGYANGPQSTPDPTGAVSDLTALALRLLAPLGQILLGGGANAATGATGNSTVTNALINLAYTLVSTLLGPGK